jgi:hypothetical protein
MRSSREEPVDCEVQREGAEIALSLRQPGEGGFVLTMTLTGTGALVAALHAATGQEGRVVAGESRFLLRGARLEIVK